MKKTLIALMVLAGVAMAVEPVEVDITSTTGTEFNADWNTTLVNSGWEQGDSYTLYLQVTGNINDGQFMKLADNCWLVTQTSGGPYFGVNTAGNNRVTKSDVTFQSVTEGFSEVRVLTAGDNPLAAWSQNGGGTASETRAWNNDLLVTINYDAKTGTLVQYTYGGTVVEDRFVMPDVSLDLSVFAVRNAVSLGGGSLFVTKAVPEPATGTLSLLALAGLAARRRRK